MIGYFPFCVTETLIHHRMAREDPAGANPSPVANIDHHVNG